jgi:hypothetical protein
VTGVATTASLLGTATGGVSTIVVRMTSRPSFTSTRRRTAVLVVAAGAILVKVASFVTPVAQTVRRSLIAQAACAGQTTTPGVAGALTSGVRHLAR